MSADEHTASQPTGTVSDGTLLLVVLTLGIVSMGVQVLILREFLSVFYGNELVIGILLANWMILTGTGAMLGYFAVKLRYLLRWLIVTLLSISIVPFVLIIVVRVGRNIVFLEGSMIGLGAIWLTSFLLLIPLCLLIGFAFVLCAQAISKNQGLNLIAKTYAWESIGGAIGGVLCNSLLFYFFSTFQNLLLLSILTLGVGYRLCAEYPWKSGRYAILAAALAMTALVVAANVEILTRQFLFRNQTILTYTDTPYGALTVTQQSEQVNFFENGVLLFSTNDPVDREEAVHFAMVQHPDPKSVLLVSKGLSGTMEEILKYGIDTLDYVELNPWLIEIGTAFTSVVRDPRIRIHSADARRFLSFTTTHYDVVLMNIPDPTTAQLNRYFTRDFFDEVRAVLRLGGIVSLSLLEGADYYGPEAKRVSSILRTTLQAQFKNVIVVPGTRNYFLASDSSLTLEIGRTIDQKSIATRYVNRFYLDDELLQERSRHFVSQLSTASGDNGDFSLAMYYAYTGYWLTYIHMPRWIPIVIVLLAFGILFSRTDALNGGIAVAGFSASSLEILIILSTQILFGYLYQMMGVIIALFMAGLAFGAFADILGKRKGGTVLFIGSQSVLGVTSLLLPLMVYLAKSNAAASAIGFSILLVWTFVIASETGFIFSLAARLRQGAVAAVASNLYGVDLVGSAIGALATAAFFLPLLGMMNVCILIAGMNFCGAMISMISKERIKTSSFVHRR